MARPRRRGGGGDRASLPRRSATQHDDGAKKSGYHIGLAGEYLVAAELALRRRDAWLAVGHAKQLDIVLADGRKIEVKATADTASKSKVFKGWYYDWIMHEKHERIRD